MENKHMWYLDSKRDVTTQSAVLKTGQFQLHSLEILCFNFQQCSDNIKMCLSNAMNRDTKCKKTFLSSDESKFFMGYQYHGMLCKIKPDFVELTAVELSAVRHVTTSTSWELQF